MNSFEKEKFSHIESLELLSLTEERLAHVPDFNSEEAVKVVLSRLMEVYNNLMPFNRLLGIEVIDLSIERAVITISSKEELQGNYIQKILHGGVISSVIDLAGGIIAQTHAIRKLNGKTIGEILLRFSKMSTLNMRVDYLKPGAGATFKCISKVERAGNKVAVTRMEMFNDKDELIAIGTGSYLIG